MPGKLTVQAADIEPFDVICIDQYRYTVESITPSEDGKVVVLYLPEIDMPLAMFAATNIPVIRQSVEAFDWTPEGCSE